MASNEVAVELDRPRTLRFNLAALSNLQLRSGLPGIISILRRIDDMDVDLITLAFWIGLSHEDSKLTIKRVQQLIQDRLDGSEMLSTLGRSVARAIAMGSGFTPLSESGAGESGGEDGKGKDLSSSLT